MRKLVVFNQVSIDGYFVDNHRDMSWAKQGADEEFNRFSSDRARGGGVLLFGRVTYELMASFWPTREAAQAMPSVAERMNHLPKVVFSRTMKRATLEQHHAREGRHGRTHPTDEGRARGGHGHSGKWQPRVAIGRDGPDR